MPTALVDRAPLQVTQPDIDYGTPAIYDRPGIQPGDDLTLGDCRANEPPFAELVSAAARNMGVDSRALGVRVLLHLPRVATISGRVTRAQVERELFHSARILRKDAAVARHLVPDSRFALEELIFAQDVDAPAANKLFSSLHYLKSARPGSQNFALLDPVKKLPVAICSVSPFEWKRVGSQIHAQFGIPRDRTWDVSRVYACDAAPRNVISFLLARVRSSLGRRNGNIDLLVTAVDPNLGFTGSSYRAANWQRWLSVQPRPYLYYDRRYVSPRQLRQRFGTSSLTELQTRHPSHRFEQSRTRLLDSLIFCCQLNGVTEIVPESSQRRLHR